MTALIEQIYNHRWFQKVRALPRTTLMAGAAIAIALVAVAALWLREPDFQPLYTNVEAEDGGAIINALEQRGIPYQFGNQGHTILVPADQIYALRLQLAEQGLPRSGTTGFELLDEPKFGTSQFIEQVQYQRALEGELARSIEVLQPVRSARVHLALPRQTLFVREQEQPTASVLVNLYPGRTLSKTQVQAMQRLIAASIPKLNAEAVSVIDQEGRLLTQITGDAGLSATQEDVRTQIEQRALQRILTLLTPIVGSGNVRAEVNAQVDFTRHEQTSERYAPNERPGTAAIRSKQTARSVRTGMAPVQGIPGALTNQPPASAQAPLGPEPPSAESGQSASSESPLPTDQQEDATINYEIDRTITHIRQATGTLERLSVAVVVNYRTEQGDLYAADSPQILALETLVRRAVGYTEDRGDTISLINSPFNDPDAHLAIWENPAYQQLAWQLGKALFWLVALILLWRSILRPLYMRLLSASPMGLNQQHDRRQDDYSAGSASRLDATQMNRYADNLKTVSDLAQQDPRAVAMVLRTWMNNENAHR